ncbi:MAG TPA: helix-turn-helix transcriptional regulator [Bryobacteraceae bacterium]|nr:helix-turn-helix transcriptional regulator [Bryobacteraceae bacterium]
MRHAPQHGLLTQYDPKPGVSISTLAYEYPPGFNVPEHSHGSDQVIYAIRGVMEIACGPGFWLIPPHFAIWIPARTTHNIRMPGAVSMRTLYLRRGLARGLPNVCTVLNVTPLLRELIVEAVRIGQLRGRNALHRALRDLIISHLENAAPVPSFVTLPQDGRALLVAQTAMANLRGCGSFQALCEQAGASPRTIERIFRREIGLSFESWRSQFRLMKAIELLAGGSPVKEVAYQIGYRQPSAFVEKFRRTMGATPKAWASSLRKTD